MNEEMPDWEREAYEFAKEAHKGQTYSNGKDYMDDHILPVVHVVKQVTDDMIVIIATYLHDTLEDTSVTYEELKLKFGSIVANLVREVTNEQVYGVKDYFPNLKSKRAIIIKFADRLQNLSRMEVWNEKRQQRYLNRSKFWKNKEDVIESLNGQIRTISPFGNHWKEKELEKLFKSLDGVKNE